MLFICMATKEWKEKNIDKLREYRRRWYDNNADHAKAEVVRRKIEMRRWLIELKSTLKCNKCGEKRIGCLQFHHTDPSKKEINIAAMIGNGWSKKRMIEEIAKCEVLCANCHMDLHWNERNADLL